MSRELTTVSRPLQETSPTMRDLLAVIFRQRWLVLIVFTVSFLAILSYGVLAPPYRTEMKVLLRRGRVDPAVTPTPSHPEFEREGVTEEEVNTEAELLQDDEILRAVVQNAGLVSEGHSWFWSLAGDSEERQLTRAVRRITKRLTVEPLRKTSLIAVRYESSDPEKGAKVLRCLASAYLDRHHQVHRPSGEFDFFDQQVTHSRRALEAAELQLMEFTRDQGVISAGQERDIALQRLSEMDADDRRTQVAMSENSQRIKALQLKLNSLPERTMTQIRNADNPQLLERIKGRLLDLELKRTELLTQYEPGYRSVQEVDEEIAQTKAAIAAEDRTPVRDQSSDLEPNHEWAKSELLKAQVQQTALAAHAEAENGLLAHYREVAHQLGDRAIGQEQLLHDLKAAEDEYLLYVNKREEARIGDTLDQGGILNVAIAEQPTVPVLPRISALSFGLIGLAFGGTASLGLAFATDYLSQHFELPTKLLPTWALRSWRPCRIRICGYRIILTRPTMSTFIESLSRMGQDDVVEPATAAIEQEEAPVGGHEAGRLKSYAQEQIRGLVRQIFLPGWRKPSCQVVFSAVDDGTDVGVICMQIAKVLAGEAPGTVCLVKADIPQTGAALNGTGRPTSSEKRFGTLQDYSVQLSSKLWVMAQEVFLGGNHSGFSAAWLRGRLAELRLEFDYTILQGPAAGSSSAAALLGRFCDGLVLVLEANSTRRVAAQKTKELLGSANTHLLGTVLSERSFPIPETIYRRL